MKKSSVAHSIQFQIKQIIVEQATACEESDLLSQRHQPIPYHFQYFIFISLRLESVLVINALIDRKIYQEKNRINGFLITKT